MRRFFILALCAVACAWTDAAVAVKTPKRAPARRPVAAVPRAPKKSAPATSVVPARPGLGPLAPYRGAVAMDADTGRILFADAPDRPGRPASVTKLMTLLLVLEDLQAGRYTCADRAAASAYAATMEPSKVGLRRGETMTVEDLLKALMLKSANDAAVVLAEHAAWRWSQGRERPPEQIQDTRLVDSFIARMNRRAAELGMANTRYASPNGLPPPRGATRGFDVSTAADLARLARHLVMKTCATDYTRLAYATVTDGAGRPFPMQNHNYFVKGNWDPKKLCTPVAECDGLKTGFTAASGSSIVLTAGRRGRRVVVVVLSSAGRHERERAAAHLLADALDAVSN